MSEEDKRRKSEEILKQLEALPELSAAKSVMAFAALPDEVDLTPLWRRLIGSGRHLLFPVLLGEGGRMDAAEVTDIERDLKPGRYGIAQPKEGIPVDPRTIDFIFIPAVAFDAQGNRLGRGGGYYDRFLSSRAPQAFRCGVAFECQVVKGLPVKDHDCHVQALVTEKDIRRFPATCGA